MAISLPPHQPAGQHARADAEVEAKLKQYRVQKEREDRRRREERERALIAESRRKASETSQRR